MNQGPTSSQAASVQHLNYLKPQKPQSATYSSKNRHRQQRQNPTLRNGVGNFMTASAANVSKASTASHGFGVSTPAEKNAQAKENLQPNYELARREKGGGATDASTQQTKSMAES